MVVGISMVKDEIDFIERTVEHMAYHCDSLLIFDNGSTDGTREYLESAPGVSVLDDPEPGYYQSAKVSALATFARVNFSATWVVPFDADELWVGRDARERIADLLTGLPDAAMICDAAVIDHVATGDPAMPWRREQQLPLRKVACRAVEGLVIHQGNHGATFPENEFPLRVTDCLRVHHFPYRTPEQFIRKARNGAAAYEATDLPEDVGAHWRSYGKMTDEELRALFVKWYFRDDPESALTIDDEHQGPLVYDPAPRRLVRV